MDQKVDLFKLPLKRSTAKDPQESQHDDDAGEVEGIITVDTLPQAIKTLQEAALKNSHMRIKYAKAPDRFEESEEELWSSLHAFLSISTDEVCMRWLSENGDLLWDLVTQILAEHPNDDLRAKVVEVLGELLETGEGSDLQVASRIATCLTQSYNLHASLRSHAQTIVDLGNEQELVKEAEIMACLELLHSLLELGRIPEEERKWIPWLLEVLFLRHSCTARTLAGELFADLILLDDKEAQAFFVKVDGMAVVETLLAVAVHSQLNGSNGDKMTSDAEEHIYNLLDIVALVGQCYGDIPKHLLALIKLKKAVGSQRALGVLCTLLSSHSNADAFVKEGALGILFGMFSNLPKESEQFETILEAIALIGAWMTDKERYKRKWQEPCKMDLLLTLKTINPWVNVCRKIIGLPLLKLSQQQNEDVESTDVFDEYFGFCAGLLPPDFAPKILFE